MRGTRSGVLAVGSAGAAAFFLVLAALSRLLLYADATLLPADESARYQLVAADASYFDLAALHAREGVGLVSTTVLAGDRRAATEQAAVTVELTSVATLAGRRVDYRERRVAVDRRTGLALPCCGGYVGDRFDVRQVGVAFRWPYGAERRSYPSFDPVLRREVSFGFERVERVGGLETYRYSYELGPAPVPDGEEVLPGRVVGGGAEPVTLSRYATVRRTVWVEPRSGFVVKVAESRADTLRTGDGTRRLAALDAEFAMAERDVAARVGLARAAARQALLVGVALPLLFLLLGLGCGGAVLYVLRGTGAWGRARPFRRGVGRAAGSR